MSSTNSSLLVSGSIFLIRDPHRPWLGWPPSSSFLEVTFFRFLRRLCPSPSLWWFEVPVAVASSLSFSFPRRTTRRNHSSLSLGVIGSLSASTYLRVWRFPLSRSLRHRQRTCFLPPGKPSFSSAAPPSASERDPPSLSPAYSRHSFH